jgi:hypothetical protein
MCFDLGLLSPGGTNDQFDSLRKQISIAIADTPLTVVDLIQLHNEDVGIGALQDALPLHYLLAAPVGFEANFLTYIRLKVLLDIRKNALRSQALTTSFQRTGPTAGFLP